MTQQTNSFVTWGPVWYKCSTYRDCSITTRKLVWTKRSPTRKTITVCSLIFGMVGPGWAKDTPLHLEQIKNPLKDSPLRVPCSVAGIYLKILYRMKEHPESYSLIHEWWRHRASLRPTHFLRHHFASSLRDDQIKQLFSVINQWDCYELKLLLTRS